MTKSESTPIVVKAGFLISSMVLSVVAWKICQQPPPNPVNSTNTTIMAGVFAINLVLAHMVLPLLMRKLTKVSPYNCSHMLIRLAFHEYGILLGFVLAMQTHDFHYLVYFAVPCLLLLALTPVGEMPKPKDQH